MTYHCPINLYCHLSYLVYHSLQIFTTFVALLHVAHDDKWISNDAIKGVIDTFLCTALTLSISSIMPIIEDLMKTISHIMVQNAYSIFISSPHHLSKHTLSHRTVGHQHSVRGAQPQVYGSHPLDPPHDAIPGSNQFCMHRANSRPLADSHHQGQSKGRHYHEVKTTSFQI